MSTPTRAFSLNNNDLIFAEIRDAHMTVYIVSNIFT